MTQPIVLTIPGPPRGKGRPRFVRATGRAYTPAETEQAEADVLTVWLADGQPRIDGPVALRVEAVMQRPAAHWLRDGSLSSAGKHSLRPTRKPDVDNILKLIADALSGRAFGDDALIVEARCAKWWAGRREAAHVIAEIAPRGARLTAIRSVIALTSGRALCARCEHFHTVTGGERHAVEPELPHLPICDVCASWDDPAGYAAMAKEAT